MSQEQKRASDAAQLLGNQLGIHFPREVKKFIGSTQLIGPALATAFNASIYLALAAALFQALTNMDKLTDKLFDWSGAMERNQKSLKETNILLVAHAKALKGIREENALAGLTGIDLARARAGIATGNIAETAADRARLLKEIAAVEAISRQTNEFITEIGILQAPTKAAQDALDRLPILRDHLKLVNAELEETKAKGVGAAKGISEAVKAFDELRLSVRDSSERIAEFAADETVQDVLFRGGFPAELLRKPEIRGLQGFTLPVLQPGEVRGPLGQQVLGAELSASLDDLHKFNDLIRDSTEGADEFGLEWRRTMEDMAEVSRRKFEKTAQTIEQFLDRTFLSARSFSDVWRQLWMQSVSSVIKQFARLAAGWWHSQGAMAGNPGSVGALSALASGGGGGFSLFGGGGGGGGSGIASQRAMSSYDLSLGIGSRVAPGSSFGATANSIGGPLPGRTGFGAVGLGVGVAGLLGAQLAGIGINRGSLAMGGIGGALAGGAAGFALSAAGLLGSSAFALGLLGPTIIGAGIAGAIGIILAARNRGRQKRETASIHEQYLFAADRIIQDFERHRIGYDPAVGSLTQLYDATVQSLTRFGGPGRRTISEITGKYQGSLRRLDDIQAIREGRLTTIGGLQIPSFQVGGISKGGLAFLEAGEGVLTPRATAAIGGKSGVDAMNRGAGAGAINITINAMDARNLDDWWKRNQGALISAIRRARGDRRL